MTDTNDIDAMYKTRYFEVAELLDETLGTEEEGRSGDGIVQDVHLLAQQRNEARAELEKIRAQLTAANRRADGLEADLRSANTANTTWANQTAGVTDEPGPEVTKVYDRDGDTWIRSPQGWRYRTPAGDGDPWPWDGVAELHGPLSAHAVKAEVAR